MYGADAAELEALARRMTLAADQFDHVRASIRSGLHAIRWNGPDAEMVRRQWEAKNGPVLTNAAQGLRQAAASLRDNAKQQVQASLANGTTGAAAALARLDLGRAAAVGTLGASLSPAVLAGFIAQGVDDNVLKELGALVDAHDLPGSWPAAGAAAAKLSGASATFGGLALASFLAGQIFPHQRLGAEAFEHSFEVGSAGFKMAGALISNGARLGTRAAAVGPVLGIVSGGLGLMQDFGHASAEGWTGANIASAGGHSLVAAGSAVMLIPVPGAPQIIGAGMVATGTVIEGGVWVYKNWDHISPYLDAGAQAVVGGIGDAAHAVVDVGRTMDHAVDAVGHGVSRATTSTWHAIKGIF